MKNPNPIEEIYVNLDIMRGLGLTEDFDIMEALNNYAGPDFSVVVENGEASIFGKTVDEAELENMFGIHFTTERGLGYYASYSRGLPADSMS